MRLHHEAVRGIGKYLAGSVLSVALFFSSAAQAMPIPQWDGMAHSDQGNFGVVLVKGTINTMLAQGKSDDAQKVIDLFTIVPSGQSQSSGVIAFKRNLEGAREINKNNQNDPNKRQLEVEDAFWSALNVNGINFPVDQLYVISKDFKLGASVSIPDKNPPTSAH